MKNRLFTTRLFPIITFFSFFFFGIISPNLIYSATANHMVISEIQISGETATDEFIELYNPTNSSIDMEGWRLTRKTSSGGESNLVSSISGIVPANGYFLITHSEYLGSTTADINYSASTNAVASNNTVLLYSDNGVTLVDKVGLGTASDAEGTSIENPSTGQSVERKASSSSTISSMIPGGTDELLGNGEDTDANSDNFVNRELPQPQNISSSTESDNDDPSPTVTPTPVPTNTPIPNPNTNILISEVQISGTTSTDEFVELYNPNDNAVNLTGWKLSRMTSSGSKSTLVSDLDGTIPPHGYYLVTHSEYDGGVPEDILYSTSGSIASNNTVALYDNITETPVDLVGMGTASITEQSSIETPSTDGSIERKSSTTATAESMQSGGGDETNGNSYDTDNNNENFVIQTLSNPQNSSSDTEKLGNNPTPTPTVIPTISPTPTSTPNPTATPTVQPTVAPTPTSTPTPIPTPSPIPEVKSIIIGYFPLSGRVCTLTFRLRVSRYYTFYFPRITCS